MNTTNDLAKSVTVMSTSAATAGSNDTVANSMAQELVFGGNIKIRVTILIGRLIEINHFEEMEH